MTKRQGAPDIGARDGNFAITVEFKVRPGAVGRFRELVVENAGLSLRNEPECHRFDVLVSPHEAESDTFVLYEIYKDRAAFAAHLDSRHFKAFDLATRDLVLAKTVRELVLLGNPAG